MKLQRYGHQVLLLACLAIPAHTQTSDNNLEAVRGLANEISIHLTAALQATEADQRSIALEAAADAARKGLAALAVNDNDAAYAQAKIAALPIFYSALGRSAMDKSDWAAAIDLFKKELSSTPIEQTQTSERALLDTFQLATAYMKSGHSSLPSCAFYATRAAHFFAGQDKVQMWKTAQYCYQKYHGKIDGFETLEPIAAANLNPPAGFTITPGPGPRELIRYSTPWVPDPVTLALADKEFILANGSSEDADNVFITMKGSSVTIPNAIVVSASAKQIQASVGDDAVQEKRADFTFDLRRPLKKVPHPGEKLTMEGTYDAYTKKPLMIVLISAAVR